MAIIVGGVSPNTPRSGNLAEVVSNETPGTTGVIAVGSASTPIVGVSAKGGLRRGFLHVANITAGAVTLTVYCRPSGAAEADSNAVLKGVSFAANTCTTEYTKIPIQVPPGYVLSALASAGASLNIRWEEYQLA